MDSARRSIVVLSVAVLLAAAAVPAGRAADSGTDKAERARLSGVWHGFTVEGKGETSDRGPVEIELTVTDAAIAGIQIKGKERVDHGRGDYTLDLAADPRVLDASQTNARGRKDVWMGIYSLDGDTLKWCVGKKERPKTFETVKGQFLLILKRQSAGDR